MKSVQDQSVANLTCLQGSVITTKNYLRERLGDPLVEESVPFDKVMTEWVIQFEDGEVATLYDWKLDEALGEYEEYEWHIGGHDTKVVDRLKSKLNL